MDRNVPSTCRMKGKVVLRRIGEDRLLVPVSGDAARACCVFPINETGEYIWDCLSKGHSVEATAVALAAEFDVDLPEALTDCRAFAEDLLAQRLLEKAVG